MDQEKSNKLLGPNSALAACPVMKLEEHGENSRKNKVHRKHFNVKRKCMKISTTS